MSTHTDPTVRHDIVMLFDITDGNPNGDPDAGNRPRVDPETGHGLITDVSIKRKIRDTIVVAAGDQPGYGIFVRAGTALNSTLERSYHETGLKVDKKTTNADPARAWLCENYFDIRLFGAVLSSGNTPALGQIRGPLQVSFGRSFDPVTPSEHAITRQVHTTEKDEKEKHGGTMGNKWTIPYGLYKTTLSYSATRGVQTGVTEQDLVLLYRCLENLFDHTSSAARATMATRKLFVFTHDDAFGKAPMHALVDRVKIARREGVDLARSFDDYVVSVDQENLPNGVTLDELT
ncbi:MAG TPA: type I-C CRISPR-associated protein Cas7/Csd2 [Arachnia sp.]|nr:type I-C CRISPR-associated protein Cas7/Csd2 [Arachnia sp.]HMT86550.1 type I-C CRISPR-associated protein Cas7/Csd2 [Arachnia sp.]